MSENKQFAAWKVRHELRDSRSNCLACGRHLAMCGKPFTANIPCSFCGCTNVYVESQRPESLLVAAKDIR